MSDKREAQTDEYEGINEYQSFAFHPYNILLSLFLFSATALFLSLTAAFIYSRVQSDQPPVALPSIFLFNTLILVASSGTLILSKRAYLADNTDKYKQALWLTLGLSVVFLIAQIAGWAQLISRDIAVNSGTSASYLYLISALHFAHVIGGIPFLGVFLFRAYKRMRDPVSVLVYFSDPDKRLRLRLLTIYWHFLDGMWIYLVLFFWLNYLFWK